MVNSDDGVSIYEYRRYECCPGKRANTARRFEGFALPLFVKHGIRCLGLWQVEYGNRDCIHYILVWNSHEERERNLAAFQADPEWVAAFKESEADGPLVSRVCTELWKLYPFSPIPGISENDTK
jgi:hypothetical protein